MSVIKKQYEINEGDGGFYSVSRVAQQVIDTAADNASGNGNIGSGYYPNDINSMEYTFNVLTRKCRLMVEEARNIVMKEADEAHKKGYKKAYDETFATEYTKAEAFCVQSVKTQINETEIFIERYKKCCEENSLKGESLDKALKLAEEIISTELRTNDEALFGIYLKAAQHVSNVRRATVKTTKRGKEIIEADKDKYEDAIDGLEELKVELKEGSEGTCVLETELGNIDASVQSQLSRVRNIMMPKAE